MKRRFKNTKKKFCGSSHIFLQKAALPSWGSLPRGREIFVYFGQLAGLLGVTPQKIVFERSLEGLIISLNFLVFESCGWVEGLVFFYVKQALWLFVNNMDCTSRQICLNLYIRLLMTLGGLTLEWQFPAHKTGLLRWNQVVSPHLGLSAVSGT